MSKREALKIGDRVRVYGSAFSIRERKWLRFEAVSGRIKETDKPCDEVLVDLEFYGEVLCNPRQCVRLLPRKKPCPPQAERVERWLRVHHDKTEFLEKDRNEAEIVRKLTPHHCIKVVHLVELKPGEVIVQSNELFLHLTRQLDFAHNSVGAEIIRNALKPKQGSAP